MFVSLCRRAFLAGGQGPTRPKEKCMTRIRRSLLLVWLAATGLCLVVPLQAQQTAYTVTGRVRDADTGGPLAGVQIVIRGTRFGALSNSAGVYTLLAQLAQGSYTLEAQMIGRETQTQAITLG